MQRLSGGEQTESARESRERGDSSGLQSGEEMPLGCWIYALRVARGKLLGTHTYPPTPAQLADVRAHWEEVEPSLPVMSLAKGEGTAGQLWQSPGPKPEEEM